MKRSYRDPVEAYLHRLARWAPPQERDELVAEARRHLHDAALRLERAGMNPRDARRAATRAFGPAWRIGLAARGVAIPLPVLPRQVGRALSRLRRPRR